MSSTPPPSQQTVVEKMSVIWHLLSLKILDRRTTNAFELYMMNPAKMERDGPLMATIHAAIETHRDKWADIPMKTLIQQFLKIMPDADIRLRPQPQSHQQAVTCCPRLWGARIRDYVYTGRL